MSVNTLVRKIREKNNPTVAGLDARLEYIPAYITEKYTAQFGTPAVGDKVQVQIYAINTLSGYASTRQTTVTNIAEESAGS